MRYRFLKNVMLLLGTLLLLSGCGSVPKEFASKRNKKLPIQLNENEKAHPFQLYKIKMGLDPNQIIASRDGFCITTPCPNQWEIRWTGNYDLTTKENSDYFFSRFDKFGYPVLLVKFEDNNKDSLTTQSPADNTDESFDYLVGGKVIEYKLDPMISNFITINKALYLKMVWQVYSKKQGKVVFETSTVGACPNFSGPIPKGFRFAVWDNIDNLLGNQDFHDFIKIKH